MEKGQNGNATLVARTFAQNGVEKSGLRIYYVAEALFKEREKYKKIFDQLSSPTNDQKLAVADYYMWVVEPTVDTAGNIIEKRVSEFEKRQVRSHSKEFHFPVR